MTDTDAGKENEVRAAAQEPAGAMRLRADTPRVTRISRRVMAGLGLAAGLGVGGALVYALQTADRRQSQEELFTTARRQTADGLQGLPSDYSGIPQLGPPLPGDLAPCRSRTLPGRRTRPLSRQEGERQDLGGRRLAGREYGAPRTPSARPVQGVQAHGR